MLEKHGDLKFAVNLLIYLLYIIIIPIIIYDTFLIVQTIIKPSKTPDFFGYKTFSIVSGSMEPTLSINDIVIIKKCDINSIQKDDIITFKIENEIITHRVINIKLENGFKVTNNTFISINKEFIWPDLNNEYYSEIGTCYALKDHIGILVDGHRRILQIVGMHAEVCKSLSDSDMSRCLVDTLVAS